MQPSSLQKQKDLSVESTKVIKNCFKNFTAIFKSCPDQEIIDMYFVQAIKNRKLSADQQKKIYIYGFKELVIRSEDSATEKYWESYQKIFTSIMNPSLTFGGTLFLDFQLDKMISKYLRKAKITEEDYKVLHRKIISLFST